MEINERITKVIEFSKLTASEFADEIEVQRSSISHIVSGRNKPSLEFVTKVKYAFPELQWDWLITGEGSMLKEKEDVTNVTSEDVGQKMSLPDLFTMIDSDNFGQAESGEKLLKANASDSHIKEEVKHMEITLDSQRLSETPKNTVNPLPKVVKRIVFFYEDGTFETFQN